MELKKTYEGLPKDIQQAMAQGNIFFSEEFSRYSMTTGSTVWYIYNNDYVLPLSISEKLMIKQGLFLSEPMGLHNRTDNEEIKVFLDKVMLLLHEESIAWVSTSAAALFKTYPSESQRIPFGSHIIDLTLPEEDLLMNMHSKHRNSVRRAERNGVEIVSGGKELIQDYLKADVDTWERSERNSYGGVFFERILDNMRNKSILYIAYKDGKPQAGACYFFNRKMCYYMYGASISNPEPGAANLLQWVAIQDMKKNGVEKFSFVGCRINEDEDSKYHGIQRFKERFGGTLDQGFMFKTILSPVKYRLFRRFYKIKKGVDCTDAIDQEIRKWPELQNIESTQNRGRNEKS